MVPSVKMIESAIGSTPLIVIDGDLDQSSKQPVSDAIGAILHGPYPPDAILIDLTDCTFLDSGGLSVLLYTLAELPASGWLGLIGASDGANRVLTYTGFLDINRVRFFSSLSDAAASLAREEKLLQKQAQQRTRQR
jgi:anti-anti-sigma factor